MKILMIAINDPAGTAIEFTKAINKYTEHSCRLITKEIRYNFMFAKDLHLPWLDQAGWEEVEALFRTSDIFHFHMTSDEYTQLGPFRPVDFLRGKRVVHHHHGHPDFRSYPDKFRLKYKERGRRNLLVSTPDLLKLLPEAKWQPNLVPITDALYLPFHGDREQTVRISHSPTRKALKNTVEFELVLEKLKKRYPCVREMIVENTLHKDCLKARQSCDIHFDHMQGYFGVSSLEGLSQGKPVIAGLDDWNARCIKEFTGSHELPWQAARNEQELYHVIQRLVSDPGLRQQIGEQSRNFMEKHWTEKHALSILLRIYQGLD